MGKTATRGNKGAKSRAGGGVSPTFEGGQTPLHRRTPKRGHMAGAFLLAREPAPLNLGRLQAALDAGSLNGSKRIDVAALAHAGLICAQSARWGVKLLAGGASTFSSRNLDIAVTAASAAAIAAVENAGGRVTAVYHSPLVLRALLREGAGSGHGLSLPLKAPAPPPRLMPFYTSAAKRGYLSSEVQLAELRRRLALGEPLQTAAQVMPVYAVGPASVAAKGGIAPASRDDTRDASGAAASEGRLSAATCAPLA